MATVAMMLEEIMASKEKKKVINEKLNECLENAAALCLQNIKHFTSVDECIKDATMQYNVLRDLINNNEKLMLEVNFSGVEAFKKCQPEMYAKLQRMVQKPFTETERLHYHVIKGGFPIR